MQFQREGCPGCYRLPSETEWEYAYRAGSTSTYYWGDEADATGQYAWYTQNSGEKTHPAGQLKPNAWGLYDMAGNVYEWVADCYHESYAGAPGLGAIFRALAAPQPWVTGEAPGHGGPGR